MARRIVGVERIANFLSDDRLGELAELRKKRGDELVARAGAFDDRLELLVKVAREARRQLDAELVLGCRDQQVLDVSDALSRTA